MSTDLSLSTDGMPPREAVEAWHGWMAQMFHGLKSDVYGDTQFEGQLRRTQAGAVQLIRLEANRHRVTQPGELSRLQAHEGFLKIVAPWQGQASIEQHGRQACARPGDWAIYDTSDRYVVQTPERAQHLIVLLPKSALATQGLRLDALMGRCVGGSAGIARVALEAMRSTYLERPHMSAQAARGAGELIVELVRLSLGDLAGRSTAATQAEALRDRVRAYIGRNLHDATLSLDSIATALNCSKRLLHKSFLREELTLAQFIQNSRLEGCMLDLQDPAQGRRSLTEIAFSWGFSSSAHFSRVFKAHTGCAPSDYRRAYQTGSVERVAAASSTPNAGAVLH